MSTEAVVVESRIEEVTVFARGARVRRVTSVPAPLPARVRLGGLPVGVIDDTVRAEAHGGAIVTLVRTSVDVPAGETRAEDSADVRDAKRRVALLESELERLGAALKTLASGSIIAHAPADEAPAPWGAIVAARRALVALRAERELELSTQYSKVHRELEQARRALEVAVERDRRAGSARAARVHELRKYVELELVAAESGAGDVVIHIEYQVAAARWAPSYVARLDDGETKFELRAIVAQDSGEDWNAVALRLSTAEPEQFAQLPELHPQKIGRRQQEPARRGFREPPAGAEALYADYDRQFRRDTPPASGTKTMTMAMGGAPSTETGAALSNQVWDEGTSVPEMPRDMPAQSRQMPPSSTPPGAPGGMPLGMPMPAAAPMSAPRSKSSIVGGISGAVAGAVAAPFALAAQALGGRGDAAAPGGGGGLRREAAAATPVPRLDYGSLVMGPPSASYRGKLMPSPIVHDADILRVIETSITTIERLRLPPGHVGEWTHSYDYAFASDGKVDVKSDGAWHSIALTSRTGTARVRHVAVPREQDDVYRVAAITNPLDGPLLPGPIDIYDRGQFLLTSNVEYTPPGGDVDVGLGVDPTVKIARNVEFHEEAAGMLRGALRLVHAISIDVENLSARPIELEVRERVPVTREGDDDIEVTLGKIEPAWERWTPDPEAPKDERLRGAYRWSVKLPARAKQLLRAGYEVKIANKLELVGGNRREP